MKATLRIAVVSLALVGSSGASVLTYSWNDFASGNIPDGGRTGWQDTRTLPTLVGSLGEPVQIVNVNVTLGIKNGRNGDYRAVLTHGSDYVVLLNRVGRTIDIPAGAIDPGFGPVGVGASKFTLSDQAATDVHLYSLMDFYINKNHQLIGTYQPDGRDYAPASTYDTTPRTTSLAVFNSKDPNGDWVLNIYDSAVGPATPGQGIVQDWGIEITIVPEPVNVALGAFGGVFVLAGLYRKARQNSRPAGKV